MIKISKMADYSVVILVMMSSHCDSLVNTTHLAELTKLSEATVAKVLKLLAKAEIVRSTRGINGGYTLAKPANEITIEDIICAVDGPLMITACSDGAEPDCALGHSCSIRGRWDDVNRTIREVLRSMTLSDMIGDKQEMEVA